MECTGYLAMRIGKPKSSYLAETIVLLCACSHCEFNTDAAVWGCKCWLF